MCTSFTKKINKSLLTQSWQLLMLLCLSVILAANVVAQVVQDPDNWVTDEAITQAVSRELRMHEAISAHLIDVSTRDGVVTLSGAVSHLPAKSLAASVAMDIIGVRTVINRLSVHPLPHTDDILLNDIRQALAADPATDADNIDVTVDNGIVTLAGTVASDAERRLVTQIVEGVKGIQEINNNLALRYDQQWTDVEIQREIQRRFRLFPATIPEMISVAVEDGHVALDGVVSNVTEKYQLERIAWVNGVQSVDSRDIRIELWRNHNIRMNQIQDLYPAPLLREAIEDALRYDPRVLEFDIEIEIKNRMAILSGIVDNLKARRAAEQDARNTPGIQIVRNHILVRPGIRLSDDTLAEEVTAALRRDPVMERHDLQVAARNHKIYLSGMVDSYYEKWWTEDVVARVNGVVDIQNSLTVNYEWNWKPDSDLKADVEGELFWDLAVNSDAITVEAEDGNVLLTGKVDSWQELEKAVQNAFEGGAKSVQSRLQLRNDDSEYPILYPHPYYR